MKKHVIIDTDTNNEADDQFALAYLIKNKDLFFIDAITIAPYSHHRSRLTNVWESQELSYDEAKRVCEFLDFDTSLIYKGSDDYLINNCKETNEAVEKIIDISLKNDKTNILALGALTNIALAIIKEPRIVDRIEVIWLGGHEIGYENNLEYNFKQDVKAVKTIFESNVKLTILPCNNVISVLKININEVKENIENKSKLCDYLIKKFFNDGYHGDTPNRIVWDIAVVAYLVNKNWFEETIMDCPEISENMSYKLAKNKRKVTFVTKANRDSIYKDLFYKLSDKD